MVRQLIAVAALLAANPLAAAIIDFNSPPFPTGAIGVTNYTEDGFQFTGSMILYGTSDPSAAFIPNGSAGGLRTIFMDHFTLAATDGSIFSLNSIDIGGTDEDHAQNETTFVGLTASGEIVSQTIPGVLYTPSVFTTYTFGENFKYLQSVWLQTTSVLGTPTAPPNSYDNFVVTSVPVPPAIWLMLSGLAALGGWRKRYS